MKVLVTGATGYVGHNLALDLAEKGYDVNILVRDPVLLSHPNMQRSMFSKVILFKKKVLIRPSEAADGYFIQLLLQGSGPVRYPFFMRLM